MTLDEIVTLVRGIAGDRDASAYRYERSELIEIMVSVRRTKAVRGVAKLKDFTIDLTEGAETISPEPDDAQGVILATATAVQLLRQAYRARVDEGTLGVSWQSGLEQESTISQGAAYRGMIDELEKDLDEQILIYNAPTSGQRKQ